MLPPSLTHIAIPSILFLIAFLSIPPQLFLLPSPPSLLNLLIFLTLLTYYLSITTRPGSPPHTYTPPISYLQSDAESGNTHLPARRLVTTGSSRLRYCKLCEAYKPPRCHHCKRCKTCVVRMDHHCPWTNNCVGYANTGHFLRFVSFATSACGLMLWCLLGCWLSVYEARGLPDHMSPYTLRQLALLMVETVVGGITTLALFVLWCRSAWQFAQGYTTIETWEQERHETLVRRGKVGKQTFPYDLGVYENLAAAFGYDYSVVGWAWPLSRAPRVGDDVELSDGSGRIKGGLEYEVNGFEDPELAWPPEDPEKVQLQMQAQLHMQTRSGIRGKGEGAWTVGEWDVEGFRRRQKEDLKRWEKCEGNSNGGSETVIGGRERGVVESARTWKNQEGESLADFGVAEEDTEEDVPLAVLREQLLREGLGRV